MDTTTAALTLKLERVARRLQVKEVAARMGVTPARVSQIESGRVRFSEAAAARYRAALAQDER